MALIQIDFQSMCLKRHVKFNAFIPLDPMLMPGMEPPKGPFKTMYLLHGYSGSCDGWLASDKIGAISQLYNIAIIMPDGENHFWVDAMRRTDMYGELVGRELVEFTRRIFPLSNKREDTIIAGISMGGYGAIRNGLKYNDVFGHIIGCSPAMIINDLTKDNLISTVTGCTQSYYRSVFGDLYAVPESDMSPFWLAEQLKKDCKEIPDLFFGCGYNDLLVSPNRDLHNKLVELGIEHIYKEYPGTHDPFVFEPCLMEGLDRLPLDKLPEMPNPFWID